jgi:hypothetical protein
MCEGRAEQHSLTRMVRQRRAGYDALRDWTYSKFFPFVAKPLLLAGDFNLARCAATTALIR